MAWKSPPKKEEEDPEQPEQKEPAFIQDRVPSLFEELPAKEETPPPSEVSSEEAEHGIGAISVKN